MKLEAKALKVIYYYYIFFMNYKLRLINSQFISIENKKTKTSFLCHDFLTFIVEVLLNIEQWVQTIC